MKRMLAAAFFFSVLVSMSCKGPEGPQGPAGRPGPGSESLIDPTIMPRVLSTYPPANTQGPYDISADGQIQIRFNKVMDPTTVRHALKVFSSKGGVRIDTTSFYFIGGDFVRFYVLDSAFYYSYHPWKIGEICTVKIDSTAKDVNGNFFKSSYIMSFTSEPYFRVRSVYPPNGAIGVLQSSTVQLTFNSKIDTSVISNIHVSPALPAGRWSLSDDSIYVYYQFLGTGILSANTTYTFTVGAGAHDVNGNYLPQQFVSSFRTSSFKVSYMNPADGSTNIGINLYSIYMDFSAPVDTGSVRSALTISPAIPGHLSMYLGSSSVYYFPSAPLQFNTNYSVTLSTHLRSSNGDSLAAPYTFTFKTEPFRVTYTYPGDGYTGVSRTTSLQVSCNANIDTGSVRSSFSISPSVTGYLYLYDFSNYFYFMPASSFAANTTYTVTISTGMKSRDGIHTLTPYVTNFTTGN